MGGATEKKPTTIICTLNTKTIKKLLPTIQIVNKNFKEKKEKKIETRERNHAKPFLSIFLCCHENS